MEFICWSDAFVAAGEVNYILVKHSAQNKGIDQPAV